MVACIPFYGETVFRTEMNAWSTLQRQRVSPRTIFTSLLRKGGREQRDATQDEPSPAANSSKGVREEWHGEVRHELAFEVQKVFPSGIGSELTPPVPLRCNNIVSVVLIG
mmetsp:Transcript_10527/g.22186  ORF Transcript_10527/g.22186 Transcript_10527/m.22186 type:complete len:110 (-) Transcript_10527:468-797(-)